MYLEAAISEIDLYATLNVFFLVSAVLLSIAAAWAAVTRRDELEPAPQPVHVPAAHQLRVAARGRAPN